jgi:hypothetical protein
MAGTGKQEFLSGGKDVGTKYSSEFEWGEPIANRGLEDVLDDPTGPLSAGVVRLGPMKHQEIRDLFHVAVSAWEALG